MTDINDLQIWDLAKNRASFKPHLLIYIIVNISFWCIWVLHPLAASVSTTPWPVYPLLGWGIGLFFHWLRAYKNYGGHQIVEEFNKLKQLKPR